MFRSIMNVIRPEARAFDLASSDALDAFGFGRSKAGQSVTARSVLAITAVWASVRIIAEGLGSLPLEAYKLTADGEHRPMPSPPAWLTHPHHGLGLTLQDVLSQVMVSLLLRGNAYVFVIRDRGGPNPEAIVSIEPLDPDSVVPFRSGGMIRYRIGEQVFGPDEVKHIRGLTLPGELTGLDPITHAAAAFGTSLAAQEYGANYFENASLPPGYISIPNQLSEAGATLLRRTWERLHSGSDKAGTVGVLTEGAEFKTITLTPEQTQFLEVRRFGIQDVARLFGLPPHLLADSSNSTSWGSGLQQQNTAMSKLTLRPWAERVEAAFTDLLRSESPIGRKNAFVKLNLEGFERGSYRERVETYALGISSGLYHRDEPRRWENLPPLGDPEPAALPAVPTPSEGDAPDPDSQETDS